MIGTVITLVGKPLDPAIESTALTAVRETGAAIVKTDVLHPDRASDIFIEESGPALTAALRKKLSTLPAIDVFIQPDDAFRRKRLLVADMDATMVVQETLDEIAGAAGIKDKIAPITERAMRGELDFAEALRERVAHLKGLPVSILHDTLAKIEYATGAATLVRTMARHGARCVLVSGGFDFFTQAVAQTLGFHAHFSNRLEVEEGRLTGRIHPPILDKWAKEKCLQDEAQKMGIDPGAETMAVGDGANDIPMLQRASVGVGYFAKPAVLAATPHQIRHTGLIALLYMQGYGARELA